MWPLYIPQNCAYVPHGQSGRVPNTTQPDSYALLSFHATHGTQPVQWAQGPAIALTHPQQQAWFNYHSQQPSFYYWNGLPEDGTAPVPQSYRAQPPNHAERPPIPKESSGLGTQHGLPRATSGLNVSLKDLLYSEADKNEYQEWAKAREEREQLQQTRSRRARNPGESQDSWVGSTSPRVSFQEPSNPAEIRFLRKFGHRKKSREQHEMETPFERLSKPTR